AYGRIVVETTPDDHDGGSVGQIEKACTAHRNASPHTLATGGAGAADRLIVGECAVAKHRRRVQRNLDTATHPGAADAAGPADRPPPSLFVSVRPAPLRVPPPWTETPPRPPIPGLPALPALPTPSLPMTQLSVRVSEPPAT